MHLSLTSLAVFGLCATGALAIDAVSAKVNQTTAIVSPAIWPNFTMLRLIMLQNKLPVFYDTSDIHLVEAKHGFDSFWAVNYIHTTDNRSFLVSAHALVGNGSATQRAGILSLDEPLKFFTRNYQTIGSIKDNNGTLEPFNLTMPGGQFGMANHRGPRGEPFPSMRIFSHLPETKFDIDVDMQGPAILNAGLGSWLWGGGIQHQVSLPAARPHGTIVVNNTTLSIDSRKSFTWYDRQWGPTSANNFTWLGLYLTASDNSQSYMSVWNWVDTVNGDKSFATIQTDVGVNTVVPLAGFQVSDADVFQSKASCTRYPLEYKITLIDGSHLVVKSVRPDQEYVLEGTKTGFYSGYVQVSGNYTGYGAIDILPPA